MNIWISWENDPGPLMAGLRGDPPDSPQGFRHGAGPRPPKSVAGVGCASAGWSLVGAVVAGVTAYNNHGDS